ncbi:MAG: YifB family Mg chelatase-like AAA ATPase [Bacteroidales bacterium]|nr:YifB family Mg chelatase-like AAA ATPase [Bacteroidales bacterium]
MLVNTYGAKCIGINAVKVTVETDIRNGIGIHLVGLADAAVKESLLRTVNALQSLGYRIPGRKMVINLAPADLHKIGSGYDLPIAVGMIAASEQETLPLTDEFVIMGELGLDGAVRDIPGALSIATMAAEAGFRGCILPLKSAMEATGLDDVEIYGVRNLTEVISILSGRDDKSLYDIRGVKDCPGAACSSGILPEDIPDFKDIIGQESAKRGAEIAAAGGHNLIFIGSPGTGKSSLAKAIAGILPPMTTEEALVTRKIWSVAGKGFADGPLLRRRPVRTPHCTASPTAIIGGGSGDNILPGEVSLAHGGVLFLDEFGQMPRSVIESLRAPLEDRKVVISRLKTKVEYPASFLMVAASNPCPCGYWGEGDRCTCTPSQRMSYLSRLSGPILDRIDIQLWLHPVNPSDILNRKEAEPSSAVARRVMEARNLQLERFAAEQIFTNAEMLGGHIRKYCPLDRKCTLLLTEMMDRYGLSMRAYFRIIRVARTIADLEGAEDISPDHLCEAVGYRFLDRAKSL